MASRFVDAGGVVNLSVGATLGINTLKIRCHSSGFKVYNIELIAQDTTSTATKSKIQIPSQNVVSYGKKFTVSGTPHYDPFNGFTSGNLAAVQALIDTDTSLGLANWLHSGSYYRPYNGARVVRWVNSSGVIKTSVNMMPPNARSIGNSSSLTNATAKANASIANNTSYPTMEAGTIDHSQAEVAKTFHVREFGNGAANQGSSTSGTLQDVSMGNGHDNLAFVMDDGLTSMWLVSALPSQYIAYNGGIGANDGNYFQYITFIGTGISVIDAHNADFDKFHYAQNLPFGTHILKVANASSNGIVIDGVTVQASGTSADDHSMSELSIYQPKKPPIPEDAVVIADYMLMADFVAQTATTNFLPCKGTRKISHSRDIFYSTTTSWPASLLHVGTDSGQYPDNMQGIWSASSGVATATLPFFGNNFTAGTYQVSSGYLMSMDGSSVTRTERDNDSHYGDRIQYAGSALDVGVHTALVTTPAGGIHQGAEVASPIHTSSHYQSFETPYLHELVGGDRNMEQNNLMVTARWKELG